MKYREIKRAIEKEGYCCARRNGSVEQYVKAGCPTITLRRRSGDYSFNYIDYIEHIIGHRIR